MVSLSILLFFFFFQAEDGIRDIGVTGVQTCALPISVTELRAHRTRQAEERLALGEAWQDATGLIFTSTVGTPLDGVNLLKAFYVLLRSEERRVGKECRSRWSPYH